MQIPGLFPTSQRLVTLPRPSGEPLQLTMQPLTLGFHRKLRERGLHPPQPPRRIARDAGGKPLRDDTGMAIMTTDDRDTQYLDDLEAYHQRVAVLAVIESLQADSRVTVSAQPPTASDSVAWTKYADDVFAEMEAAGLTAGDLALLSQWTCRLSNLVESDIRRASENFSVAPPCPPT